MILIIAIFLTWVFSILSISLGLYIGSQRTETPIKFPTIIKKKHTIGQIPKVSQTDLELKGTKREGTIKAMTETLDKIL